jgi:hypothetical protein
MATRRFVSDFTSFNHSRAGAPIPSKVPGLVLGFQTPALKMAWGKLAAIPRAVDKTWSRDSALHGPAIRVKGCCPIDPAKGLNS